MNYQELTFATAIAERAIKIKTAERVKFQNANPDADMKQWELDNPNTKFLTDAFNESQSVAEFLRSLSTHEKA